ncbi:adenosylcobinamide kinase/adenosylcobinamide-phosphate guanylyltransferase [Metabacillus crassostreae]|uniref:bifunctional adenosylcobinamide kinase/adenosylcobinamide-phosphate guanylyltransferase n=1 Tax=Metabacillus crassostreae TaxID=929098 RepID=UPI00195DC311|nr:bifunctional adenosylcobinamide kinase/adenosylcobinamide-phosphate guanylyltransferase [Metabacillus crassostreae]MBM7602990.1 adenosylcobinamide kinase/adenosylcobinamide-phosphate guanylyltransferase [Metabacillus crassostreae]
MQLVVGGAYSGKRKTVKNSGENLIWHSAYNEDPFDTWQKSCQTSSIVVMEGWEKWVEEQLILGKTIDEVRSFFIDEIEKLCEAEKSSQFSFYFIMLEMGRGIVPMLEKNRNIRDVCGWILQYAANKAEEVYYCWHGLSQKIK